MSNKKENAVPGVIRVYRKLRFVLIPVVILVMGFSAYQVIRIFAEYGEGDEAYRSVDEQFVITAPEAPSAALPDLPVNPVTPEPTGEPAAAETEEPGDSQEQMPEATAQPQSAETSPAAQPERAPIAVDFSGLLALNSDCVGWIYIPDTKVSYPVMQSENNSKYLDRLPDGSQNKAGSIFMDFRNDPDLIDGNIILYGHNMQNGSMFATLGKYAKRAFFDEHRTVYYLTPNGDYKVTVFACITVSPLGDSYEMYDDSDSLQTYLKQIIKKAHVSAPVDTGRVNRIFTLSTCTEKRGTRIILLGIPEKLG